MHTDFDRGRPERNLELLRQARAAIQEGHRARARALLRQVTATDPRNETAWLELSQLVETWGEQVKALENVVAINPRNAQARERLNQLRREQPSAPHQPAGWSKAQIEQARKLLQTGRRQQAREVLLQLVQEDEHNDRAWWMLVDLVPDIRDKIIALENILTLDQNNVQARSQLARLQDLQSNLLALGAAYEERGELELALSTYLAAFTQARTPAERAQANQRLEILQAKRQSPQTKPIPLALTIARLSAGPPLLFIVMIVMQSGMDPLALSPFDAFGLLAVCLGSVCIVVTSLQPRPSFWLEWFDSPPGAAESVVRWGLGLFGSAILLSALALFLWSAWYRLMALPAMPR